MARSEMSQRGGIWAKSLLGVNRDGLRIARL